MAAPAIATLTTAPDPRPETLLRITVHAMTVTTETHPDTPETWNAICALTRLGFRVSVREL